MSKNNTSDFIIPLAIVGGLIYLAPTIKDTFSNVGGGVSSAVQGVGQGLGNAGQGLGTGLGSAGFGIGTGLGSAGLGIGTGLGSAGLGVGQGVGQLGLAVGDAGSNILQGAGNFGGNVFASASNLLKPLDSASNFVSGNIDLLSVTRDKIVNSASAGLSSENVSKALGYVPSVYAVKQIASAGKKGLNYISGLVKSGNSKETKENTSSPAPNFSTVSGSAEYVPPPKVDIATVLNSGAVKTASPSNSKEKKSSNSTGVKASKTGTSSLSTDSLSGQDKGKGTYTVTRSDGSKVKRYFQ